jgi:transposase-like protein
MHSILSNRTYRLRMRDFDQPRFLDYIDDEDTRRLIPLMLEHDNNVSKVARFMGVTEGAIRNRLRLLRAKLKAAGFNPFAEVKWNESRYRVASVCC